MVIFWQWGKVSDFNPLHHILFLSPSTIHPPPGYNYCIVKMFFFFRTTGEIKRMLLSLGYNTSTCFFVQKQKKCEWFFHSTPAVSYSNEIFT